MKWSELKLMVVTFALAAVGGSGGALFMLRHQSAPTAPKLLRVDPQQVIGPSGGNASSPYTLVEFMDYQCPPCRASRGKVQNVVKLYEGRMRLVIRHLPLDMHPNAASAAAAAEAAREQGKFWPMHEALLSGGPLSAPEIESLARKVGLNKARFQSAWTGSAKARVASDESMAEALGLDSTPSFLLCTPQREVWRLSRFDQIHELVK